MQYNNWLITILAVVAIAVLAGAYVLFGGFSAPDRTDSVTGAVALVNGEEITREELDERVAQTEANLKLNGVDVSSEEAKSGIERRALDTLVAEELLLQEAENLGLSATEEEIDNAISSTRSQFAGEDEFKAALLAEGFTEESFGRFVMSQLVAQKVLENSLNLSSLSATDEEIREYYEKSIEGSEVYPQLEEVRSQIEGFVIQEKSQEMVTGYIAGLREAGKVEIFL